MPMAEVLPVGAETLQGTEMAQPVQQGAGQVLAGEEMPILETQGEEMAQAQPVLSQTDGAVEQPVEMVSTQETVEELVNTEITVNLPMKVLCKADCKGICRQCGKDLNTGSCECDAFVPDPRMAAIKDIFYGNKEV